jgi:hypothetical protein
MFHPAQKITILLLITSAIALFISPAVADTLGRMTGNEAATIDLDRFSPLDIDAVIDVPAVMVDRSLDLELTPDDLVARNLEDLAAPTGILPVVESTASLAAVLPETIPTADALLAQSAPSESAADKKWGVSGHVQAGTLGLLGVDAGYRFSPLFNARLGINTVGTGFNYSNSGVDYRGNWQPTNIHLLGDYFPFGSNSLRLTGGFVAQNNRINSTAQANGGVINLNGVDVSASDAGTINADGGFGSSIAPYLGIGYGSPISPGLSFNADLGVMFPGSPSVKLTRSGGIASADIDNQLAQQEQRTNNDLKGFTAYPFLAIGFSYAF